MTECPLSLIWTPYFINIIRTFGEKTQQITVPERHPCFIEQPSDQTPSLTRQLGFVAIFSVSRDKLQNSHHVVSSHIL